MYEKINKDPGVIVPIHMASSGKILAQRDSFLCSTVDIGESTTEVGGAFNPSTSVSGFCCSGIDFLVQSLEHGQYAFVMAMGTVVTKTLAAGESILVDTESILCFESSVTVEVRTVGTGIAVCCCAGEGLFNTHMTGPGKIWMQSLSIDKMRRLYVEFCMKRHMTLDSSFFGIISQYYSNITNSCAIALACFF